MRIIRSRAPVRVCDMGGWTDTWFCKRGVVLNIAVDLYTHVRLVGNDTSDIRIISEDLDLAAEIKDYRKIEYDGNLDLLKAAVKRMGVTAGMDIYVRADSPPGCGTGTSASVAVAMLGALARFTDKPMLAYQIAELAHALETEELGMESGVQDQYAAAFGGISFMEIDYPRVRISQLRIEDKTICEIEDRLFVVYLGSRSSSDMHKRVVEHYRKGDKQIHSAFDELTASAQQMCDALTAGDLERAGGLMYRNWRAQMQLDENIATPEIESLSRIAEEHGAAGFKVNGAGGGGSAIILSAAGREHELRSALLKSKAVLLPCKLNFHGLQTWE
jgi:D-glycero-alpha-D-manno-heptose-7-phosphate kinase